jgi:NAD(P)-dependent dehydrogenase (short-subunit alcohol dehydrogenase family)
MTLKGYTCFITGAAKRVGRSLALAIAEKGGNLVLHHRQSPSEINSLKAEIESSGQKAAIVQADFSDPVETGLFCENLFSNHRITHVINNASIFEDLIWSETTLTDWEIHQAVNLTAPFLICQAFAKSLPENESGRIVNLLDWRALRPGPDHLPYTISKAGLAALTKALAQALAPKISVNGVALGAILPPVDGGDVGNIVTDLPNPRWAELSEVEDTVLFLLTGPEYITGEIIHLDGGRHLI